MWGGGVRGRREDEETEASVARGSGDVDKVSLEWVVRRRARGGGENVADVALIFGGDGFKIRRGGIPEVGSDRRDIGEVR